MTECLYYQDPYLETFEARVVHATEIDGRPAVALDVTAFYPTGGGQPHDTGTLNGVRVVDAQLVDGQILHVLEGVLEGAVVLGELDWERRFDHMQQHTGQHILSQAFVATCEAETVGFHLGQDLCTIDLDQAPLAPEEVWAAERLANRIVMEDRPVTAAFVDGAELTAMPLRKMPTVDGPVRVVHVSGFDWSPCGGTHVSSTGQVGLVKVMRVERRKEVSRVHFVCGWRALADYERKQQVVRDLVAHLTTSEDELLVSVERLESEVKGLRKALTEAQMGLLEHEIVSWLADAVPVGGLRVVRRAFEARDAVLLREAARQLAGESGVVALLATSRPQPQFVFAAAEGVPVSMGELMNAACAAVGGRGGGRPQFAQGGAPEGASVESALDTAMERLKSG